jgi:hypothetical protein
VKVRDSWRLTIISTAFSNIADPAAKLVVQIDEAVVQERGERDSE